MFARVGDHLIVPGTHLGEAGRDGEVIEVSHDDGSPPYLVRWEDSGRVTLFFPGPNAVVHHFTHPQHLPGDVVAPVRGGRRR